MKSLNEEIAETLDKKRLWNKWNEHVLRLSEQIAKKQIKASQLSKLIESHNHSLEDIHTMSVLKLISTVLKKEQEGFSQEQEEITGAKLKYQEAVTALNELEKEKKMYEEHRDSLGEVHQASENLLYRKKQLIEDENTVWSEKLYEITSREIELLGGEQELSEAVDAGEHVYYSLEDSLKALDKASNWSVMDLIDRGMVTTYMKHSQLDNAKDSLHRAERRLRQFQDELIDVEQHEYIQLDIGDFLSEADTFFDDIILSWLIHNRVREVSDKISSIQEAVSEFVNLLKEKRTDIKKQRIRLSEERVNILRNA
ncbi:hypothetical protein [Alkalicoccus daliensis]|uniref:Uncharacterized protein n=1 Tax=Alkalicoccus daliensis TaxID=745820 RepID=A0A1H0ALI3_9BACI|nr:hypothetical protein [Alkalicoccus daliensis]SDN34259.1 hypothetical protein SAMN04488053_101534 [Alkalicoccus daliensis]